MIDASNPGFDLSWGAPMWLSALAVLPVLAGLFIWSEHRRKALLQKLVAARLQPVLAGTVSVLKRRLRFGLLLAGLACVIVALAQPRHGYTFDQAKRKGRDVMIAIDTSRSMLATDVMPSRLARAKLAAQDLLNALEGDRAGLIAFAGSSFVQAPLTVDYNAVQDCLDDLDTNTIPLGGTNIAAAILKAKEAFGKGEGESHCLILFTDGEELEESAVTAAKEAAGSMRIFTVGVGSGDGSLIPVPGENGGTEFVKDETGNFVKSRLDESKLTEIANATGGFYTHLQNGPADMRRIVTEGLARLKENEIDTRMSRHPIERYQWPLGAGLALLGVSLLIKDRRKVSARATVNGSAGGAKRAKPTAISATAAAILLTALVLSAGNLQAEPASKGEDLYKQGKYDEALKQFDEALQKQPNSPALHFNKGTADYGRGDYDVAVEEFGKALASPDPKLRAKAEYNLGTALLQRALKRDEEKEEQARKTDLKDASEHLGQAKKLDPNATNADYNKKLAEKELAKPKPKPTPTPPPSKQDQKNNKDDKKGQQGKDQQGKDQQGKDQQGKDQQGKDQQGKDQQGKDQQGKDQQGKDQQGKDQQGKDQQGQDQQGKDQQGKDQQGKDQQSEDQKGKESDAGKPDSQENKDGKPSGTPAPPTEEKKMEGEIKPANGDDSKADSAAKPGEEAQAEAETSGTNGEMTKHQARALLDSLKADDAHPFKNEHKGSSSVLKDW